MTDPRLDDLRAAYASSNLILYAGAGISAAAGLPTWPRLAADLRARLSSEGQISPAALAEIDDFLKRSQLVDALSAIKLALGDLEFGLAVAKACDDKGRGLPDIARALAELAPKLRAVLTTNLDRFLERAFPPEWDVLTSATGDLAASRSYILKFHGTLRDRGTWVFSRDQYDRAVFASPTTRAALEALFRAFPILFVGCGLADDDLDLTLSAIRALSGAQPPVHYALVAAGSVGPNRRKTLEAAGLRLVEYHNADGKHAELPRVVRAIAGTAPGTAATAAAPAPAVNAGPAAGANATPALVAPAPANVGVQGGKLVGPLKGAQIKQLSEALISAFPSSADLEQMVLFELDTNLGAIVGAGPLGTMIIDLIKWAEKGGRTADLLRGARATNPGNPKLAEVERALLSG